MATKIVTKNSSTASAVPTASDLVQGELAVNVADKRLFTENNAGAIVELGTNPYNFTANHNGSAKLATTATGIDVTGNVVASGDLQLGSDAVASNINALGDVFVVNVDSNNNTGGTPNIQFKTSGSEKLRVSPTGIDVTGTATMDGLTVDGVGSFNNNSNENLFLADTLSATRSSLQISGVVNYFNANIDSASHGIFAWRSSNAYTERMRIDASGNVGIGTTSPSTKLEVNAGLNTEMRVGTTVNGSLQLGHFSNGTFIGTNTGTPSVADLVRLGTGGTERMRIDSAGNVGIGTSSPNASARLHIGKSGGSPELWLERTDGYLPTKLIANTLGNGQGFKINVAGTDALAIDSSGNVGIGCTPSRELDIQASSGWAELALRGVSGSSGSLEYYNASTKLAEIYADTSTNIIFRNSTNGTTEAMRIDASGNLLVGTTDTFVADNSSGNGLSYRASAGDLGVSATNTPSFYANRMGSDGAVAIFNKDGTTVGSIGVLSSHPYFVSTSRGIRATNGEVLPCTSSGVTSDNTMDLGSTFGRFKDLYLYKIDLDGGSTLDGNYAYLKSRSTSVASLTLRKDSTGADAVDYLQCRNDGNGLKLVIEGDGDVKNTNNSYGAVSDEKLKENIVDATSQWADIKAVRVRKYSLKEHDLDYPNMLGVVAQELESAGMNGLVSESIDRNEDNEDLGTVTKSVNYSILYMKAVKALQEAINRIETLEAKVAVLES